MKNSLRTRKTNAFDVIIFILLVIYSVTMLFLIAWTLLCSFKSKTDFNMHPLGFPKRFKFSNYINAMRDLNVPLTKVGYFETLRDAENNIRKIVRRKRDDVHGFVIKEMPRDSLVDTCAPLSIRRYLNDGSLWCTGGDKTAKFNEGDIVEIAYDDYVELGIVQCFDDADGFYTVVTFNLDENEPSEFCGRFGYAAYVLPPSFPVQKKYAAALRRGLKQAEKESVDALPF